MIDTMPNASRTVNLAGRFQLSVMHDEELDTRRERFFEGVARLIWDERLDLERKEAVLRRYARLSERQGDAWFAGTARQLADTYAATARQFN